MSPTTHTKEMRDRFEQMERNHGWIPEHKERILEFIDSECTIREREMQDDIQSVLAMLKGDTDREKIINFMERYLLSPSSSNTEIK